jgi:hypothetical protein
MISLFKPGKTQEIEDLFQENQEVISKTLESLKYNGVRCIRELKEVLDHPHDAVNKCVDKPKK